MKCSECKYGQYYRLIDTWFCNANKKKPKRIDRSEVDLDIPCRYYNLCRGKHERTNSCYAEN